MQIFWVHLGACGYCYMHRCVILCILLTREEVLEFDMCWFIAITRKLIDHKQLQTDRQTDIVSSTTTVLADNELAKPSCVPPSQYKATLCTTKVFVGTEQTCRGRPPHLTDTGPPCAPWCTTQVGSALRRSTVHSVVLYSLVGAQCRSHRSGQTDRAFGLGMLTFDSLC